MPLTCRDCGNVLKPGARGCPRCALNVEAETMIGRVFWRLLVPLTVLGILTVLAIVYLIR